MFAKIRWVCKVQSLGKHKNGWVKKIYSLGSGETKFPLGRGKKSTGSGSTGSVTEGCKLLQKLLFPLMETDRKEGTALKLVEHISDFGITL